MYHNYDDAENCIRAFYFLGYEAKFAKVTIHPDAFLVAVLTNH